MVVRKAIENLKEGPKEDKVAVASGIAITVVVILLAVWTISFFHTLGSGTQQIDVGGVQEQLNFSNVKDAQQGPLQENANTNAGPLPIRNDATAQQEQTQQQTQIQQTQGTGTDQSGPPNVSY